VRPLDQEELLVLAEIADGLAEKVAGWSMIDIENGKQFPG